MAMGRLYATFFWYKRRTSCTCRIKPHSYQNRLELLAPPLLSSLPVRSAAKAGEKVARRLREAKKKHEDRELAKSGRTILEGRHLSNGFRRTLSTKNHFYFPEKTSYLHLSRPPLLQNTLIIPLLTSEQSYRVSMIHGLFFTKQVLLWNFYLFFQFLFLPGLRVIASHYDLPILAM